MKLIREEEFERTDRAEPVVDTVCAQSFGGQKRWFACRQIRPDVD
jgi:hypothetical protein